MPETAADHFDLLWLEMSNSLGTAVTATLLRRACKRLQPQFPQLPAITVNRETLTYEYEIPAIWRDSNQAQGIGAFRALASQLGPLLHDLTGSIVINRLNNNQVFKNAGVRFHGSHGS